MLSTRALMCAVFLGVALYLLVFAFAVDRPLTTGEIGAYLNYKANYLASIQTQRKIAIFAGSNGRFSHRCESIAARTGIACANLSSAAGFDLRWQLSHFWPFLRKGDVLYMPLEYWPLLPPGAAIGSEAPYIMRHEHAAMGLYSASQLPFALFYFDIRFLFSGIGEMAMEKAGIQRRSSVRTMTMQGDERGADGERATGYAAYIHGLRAPAPAPAAYADPAAIAVLYSILDTARAKGVIVVGGLPTYFDNVRIPDAVVDRLRELYERHGACFLVLPNRSQYPRSAFYDTAYHLQETFQIAHSNALADPLAGIVRASGCAGVTGIS